MGVSEVSEEQNFSVLPRNLSCDILVKNEAGFFPCLKSLSEAKVKSFGFIPMIVEISKQPMKPGLPWTPQDSRDARVIEYLLRRAADT